MLPEGFDKGPAAGTIQGHTQMQKRLTVRALGALAATCLLVASASATPAKLTGDTGFLAGPGKSYDALAALDTGDKVDVIWCGTTEDWCLVSFHNKKGWVPLALLNLRPGGGGNTADGGSSSGGGSGNTASTGGGSGGSGGGSSGLTLTKQGSGITYNGGNGLGVDPAAMATKEP